MRKSFRIRLNELQKKVHVTTVVVLPLISFPLNWFLGRKKVEKIIQTGYEHFSFHYSQNHLFTGILKLNSRHVIIF